MSNLNHAPEFKTILDEVTDVTYKDHAPALITNATRNKNTIRKSIRELPPPSGDKAKSAVIVSAGPSVRRNKSIERILSSRYRGTIIAADGAYVACLKAGLIPDYVLTLDPHPTRIVRWFGDPDFEAHLANDDYFVRQDLDVEIRKNAIMQNTADIELVNKMAYGTKLLLCSSAPENVVLRTQEAGFDTYGWNPLVDDPRTPDSITRQLHGINKLPAFNTGGNVGTASWTFANMLLKIPTVALVGMDFGYYGDTPFVNTQFYYELVAKNGGEKGLEKYFHYYKNPQSGETFYTDPPYAWYRNNFFDLLKNAQGKTINCTEGGTLFGDGLACSSLDDFFAMVR